MGNIALAQDTMPKPKPPVNGFIPYFAVEYTMADMSEINHTLSNYGYPTYSDGQIGLTGGFTSIFSNVYMGFDFTSYLKKEGNTSDNHTVRLRASQFMVTPGYLLWQSNKSFVFFNIGAGIDYFEIEIQENTAVAFDSVLTNPQQVTNLTGETSWLFRPGLTGIFFFGGEEGYKRNTGGFGLLAQAGYGISFGTTNWKLFDRDVTGGPQVTLAGPYVRLGVTLGGISRSR